MNANEFITMTNREIERKKEQGKKMVPFFSIEISDSEFSYVASYYSNLNYKVERINNCNCKHSKDILVQWS